MSFEKYYAFFHPEHFLELLRAGGVFPASNLIKLPDKASESRQIAEFVQSEFYPLSPDKYEIWVKFTNPSDGKSDFFTLTDIESAHFYSSHRQEMTPRHIIDAVNSYGISIKDPIKEHVYKFVQEWESLVRRQLALDICAAWIDGSAYISKEFMEEVKIGFEYQQSAVPDELPILDSRQIWARLISYNAGLRKFEEKPDVLQLQDLQEVLKRTDQSFRDELKRLGEKHNNKLGNVIQIAEEYIRKGGKLSQWVLDETSKSGNYLAELNQLLGAKLNQQNFIYSALLYLTWREKVLNVDYTGFLRDNPFIFSYLKNCKQITRKPTAEALFTIIYAGGPRVFRNAAIEARMKRRGAVIGQSSATGKTMPKTSATPIRKFKDFAKAIGKELYKLYQSKKKEPDYETLKRSIQRILKLGDLQKGNMNHKQYLQLCALFRIQPESFEYNLEESLDHEVTTGGGEFNEKAATGTLPAVSRKKDNKNPQEGIQAELNFRNLND